MAFFTYLIPADEKYPGKTIKFLEDGSTQQIKAANSSDVYAERREFNDFHEMCDALYAMAEDRRGYIVRADIDPTYIGNRRMFKRRLGKPNGTDGNVLYKYNPQYVCLDIDGLPRPDEDDLDSINNPEAVIAHVLSTLPPYFNGVSCWWQFSSTESLPENRGCIKVHLFYMLLNPIDEKTLKDWALSNKARHYFDPSVMLSNQPIYIAPPKIEGKKDWLPVRCGVYQGDHDILDLNLFTTKKFGQKSNIVPIDQKKILIKYTQTMGDGPGLVGFNDPIKSAIGAVIQKCGPDVDREQLKADLRDLIGRAPSDPHRPNPIDKYLSDRYLDPLIEAFAYKEAEQNKASYNLYDIARQRYVYVANIHRFYDTQSGNYITKDALNMTLTKVGRSLADHFVGDDNFEIVDQITYYPGHDKICTEISLDTGGSVRCYNLYNAPIISDLPSDEAKMFVEHVKLLAGNDTVFNHMMDWMAHNVQYPGTKIMYALLIQGKQGTGKSALMEAMKMCLGQQNVRAVETHELLGGFTTWMKGKCISVVEEIRDNDNRFSIYNRLKPIITAPTITLNEKNVAQTEMRNRMNIMAFTNYETAVPMDDDDRRFFVHFSPMEPQSEEYYDELFRIIYTRSGAVRKMFLEWDLSHFNPNGRAPMTESKEFLREHAGSPLNRILKEAFKEGEWPLKYDIIIIRDLTEVLNQRIKTNETSIAVLLRSLGAQQIGRRLVFDGKRTVWSVRNHERWRNASEDEIKDYYKKPQIDPFNKTEGYIGESVVNNKF